MGLTAGFLAPFVIGFLAQATKSFDAGIYLVAGIWGACVVVSLIYFARQRAVLRAQRTAVTIS
jgi:cyanate permease